MLRRPSMRGITHGTGGGSVTITDATDAYGDSFADGGSGGGGGYFFFMTQLLRYHASAGISTTSANNAVSGSTSTQAKTAFLARTRYAARNIIWTGRNNIGTPATVIADVAAMVAARKPGERLWILSVHNFADGTENSGSANYVKIMQINAGLAALADGADVFYIDTRANFIFHALIDPTDPAQAADAAQVALDCPPASLVASGDKLHPNAVGYNQAARDVFWSMYQKTFPARANMATNGDFTANVTSWLSGDGAVIAWDAAQAGKVTGGGAYRSMVQDVATSGQSGKVAMLRMDVLAMTGKLQIGIAPSAYSGSFYLPNGNHANPNDFNHTAATETAGGYLAKRKVRNLIVFADCNAVGAAIQMKANNDATCTWMVDDVVFHNTQ